MNPLTKGPPTNGARMPPNLDIIEDEPTAKCRTGVGSNSAV